MPFTSASLLRLPAQDYLQLTTSPLTNVSFSQWGEDMILDHLFFNANREARRTTPGWYVDLGCYHPIQYSNTMLLHLRGWSGINVDANLEAIDLFNKMRPRDINIHSGISDTAQDTTFYKFEINAVSTISPDQATAWQTKNGWRLQEETPIKTLTVNDLLERHLPTGKHIDFLNIDLEGVDRRVIASLDLGKYRPTVIAIELHGLDPLDARNDSTIRKLIEHGYRIQGVCMATYILEHTLS